MAALSITAFPKDAHGACDPDRRRSRRHEDGSHRARRGRTRDLPQANGTPSGDYAAQIALVVRLVAELEQAVGAAGTVGVGIPGAISPATGLIKNANSNWLIGKPLDRDLAA